jgi:hypothetical protein
VAESVAWAATAFADESGAGVAGGVTTVAAMLSAAMAFDADDVESAARGVVRAVRDGVATRFVAGVAGVAVVS